MLMDSLQNGARIFQSQRRLIATALFLLCCTSTYAETFRVRVLDAHNARPISGEKVNVNIRGIRDDATYTTDANGIFIVDASKDAELSVATEWRVTCLEKKQSAVPMFTVQQILTSGVVEPNTCGRAKAELIPGTITIFTRKATFFENMAR